MTTYNSGTGRTAIVNKLVDSQIPLVEQPYVAKVNPRINHPFTNTMASPSLPRLAPLDSLPLVCCLAERPWLSIRVPPKFD